VAQLQLNLDGLLAWIGLCVFEHSGKYAMCAMAWRNGNGRRTSPKVGTSDQYAATDIPASKSSQQNLAKKHNARDHARAL
jgi:hypothetical protein